MSAKATDLARIQEMFDLITETQGQIERLGITEERFKRPATDADRLFSEAIMNRVLRVTEEAGSLSDEALAHYEFERRAVKGVAIGLPTPMVMWTPILSGMWCKGTFPSC